jgi:uncharacterized membrane protein YiaA
MMNWIMHNQVLVGGGIGFVLLLLGIWANKTNLEKWGVAFAGLLIKSLGKNNAKIIIDDLNVFVDAADSEVDKP